MKPERIDIEIGDPRVQKGIIAVLAGATLTCGCEESVELAAIKRAANDFIEAEQEHWTAIRETREQLRQPMGPHTRLSDAALTAYNRKLKAMDTLSELLGVCVTHAGGRRS
jgi:hypothetical protein